MTAAPEKTALGPTEQILGIQFFNGTAKQAVTRMEEGGGLLVVPAAPALVNLQYDEAYRNALLNSDLAIADSGAMVLLWRLIQRKTVKRISGLAYLKELLRSLSSPLRTPSSVLPDFFWVLPNEKSRDKLLEWAARNSYPVATSRCYVAPRYASQVSDEQLLELIHARRPSHVVIGLGGGTQEKLGLFLRESLDYRPAIHCIGAALGFLTGDQMPIPDWADRLYLGWLLRLARNPRLYVRRFWVAHELPGLIWKYRSQLPPLHL